ncbi:hypothetical protein HDU97_005350 [Phlyctochytrium planicorne]|nr:hypothetical protein HDU97_005350 [Phlyctochytrium planicorne]
MQSQEGGKQFTGFGFVQVEAFLDTKTPDSRQGIRSVTNKAMLHLNESGTDAHLMLTVSFASFPASYSKDEYIDLLIDNLKVIVNSGRGLFLNLFPDMNARQYRDDNLFLTSPQVYHELWRKYYNEITAAFAAEGRERIAFLWKPSCDVQRDGRDAVLPGNPGSITLDTNGDGVVDDSDDPYTPYFPGSSVVDWIGCGATLFDQAPAPYGSNIIAPDDYFPALLRGQNNSRTEAGGKDIWSLYKLNNEKFRKPFMWTQIGTAYRFDPDGAAGNNPVNDPPGLTRRAVKQAFWSQALNYSNLRENFPLLRAISLSEVIERNNIMDNSKSRLWANDFGNTGCLLTDTLCAGSHGGETIQDFVNHLGTQYGFLYANDSINGRKASGPAAAALTSSGLDRGKVAAIAASTSLLAVAMVFLVVWVRCRRSFIPSDVSNKLEPEDTTAARNRPKNTVVAPTTLTNGDIELDTISTPTEESASSLSTPTRRQPSISLKQEPVSTLFGPHPPDVQKDGTLFNPVAFRPHVSSSEPPSLWGAKQQPSEEENVTADVNGPEEYGWEKSLRTQLEVPGPSANGAMATERITASPAMADVATWSSSKVKQWLLEAGVGRHLAEVLEGNDVNGYNLLLMSDRKLQDLGVHLVGARNLIMFAVAQLRQEGGPGGSSRASAGSDVQMEDRTVTEADAPPKYTD